MKTGLFFGSFNPIHQGHLIIAQYMLNTGKFEEIRFIVSPQNPFKTDSELWPEELRLHLVRMAVADNQQLSASSIEFELPKPSYTIQTLNRMREIEPGKSFSIIMGSDNLSALHLWKDIEKLAGMCSFDVYQRRDYLKPDTQVLADITVHEAPLLDISATHIRNLIKNGQSIRYLVPESVFQFLTTK